MLKAVDDTDGRRIVFLFGHGQKSALKAGFDGLMQLRGTNRTKFLSS